ncbi:MAG: hypothetical protein ACRDTM_09590 [Micromonosporaceae bacterium]
MTERSVLRSGAVALALGAVAIAGFRMGHGDLPAAHPEAALEFISQRDSYVLVHLGTVLGVLAWCGGMVALAGTLADTGASSGSGVSSGVPGGFSGGGARQLARVGSAIMLVGAAVFIVDFSIDGVAGSGLADAWQAAPPEDKADHVLAAQITFTILRGTSLTAILALWGVPLVLYGGALLRAGYPGWLGATGVVLGSLNTLAALALAFDAELFPGVLLYGLLVSLLTPLWGLLLGVVTWRRAAASGSAPGAAPG